MDLYCGRAGVHHAHGIHDPGSGSDAEKERRQHPVQEHLDPVQRRTFVRRLGIQRDVSWRSMELIGTVTLRWVVGLVSR